MKITFVGDVHQNRNFFHGEFMPPGCIQVGDLAMDYYKWRNRGIKGKRFFIDGNHEEFSKLDVDAESPTMVVPDLYHIPRGYVDGRVLFIGGAESIDHKSRTMGHSMWPDESISQKQFYRVVDNNCSIDVVVSHTCPRVVIDAMGLKKVMRGKEEENPSEIALEGIRRCFMPKLWIFGHHHFNWEQEVDGCLFACIAKNDKREYDVPLNENGLIAQAVQTSN